MSIITSEISSRTEVLAAGQNTKGYFFLLRKASFAEAQLISV